MTTVLQRSAPRVKRLTTLFRHVLRVWSRETLNTSMPGIVETYDRDARRARVVPGIRALMADGTYRQRPVIVNVPVLFPSFGGVTLEGELAAGDAYWMEFSQRGLRQFKKDLKVSDWDAERVFDMSDAVLDAGARFLPDSVMPPAAGEAHLASADGNRRIRVSETEIEIFNSDGSVDRSIIVTENKIEATDGTLVMRLDASNNVAELENGNRKVIAGGSETRLENGTATAVFVTAAQVRLTQGGVDYMFQPAPTGGVFVPVP